MTGEGLVYTKEQVLANKIPITHVLKADDGTAYAMAANNMPIYVPGYEQFIIAFKGIIYAIPGQPPATQGTCLVSDKRLTYIHKYDRNPTTWITEDLKGCQLFDRFGKRCVEVITPGQMRYFVKWTDKDIRVLVVPHRKYRNELNIIYNAINNIYQSNQEKNRDEVARVLWELE